MAFKVEAKNNLTIEEIREKIQDLLGKEKDELTTAMDKLKIALRENPSVCALLLPEDIGIMVKKLRERVGKMISEIPEKKERKTKQPKIDLTNPEVQQEILDDLF